MAKKARKSARKKSSAGKRGSARKASRGTRKAGGAKRRAAARKGAAKRGGAKRRAATRKAPAKQSQMARVKRVTREVVQQAGVAVSAGVETLKDLGENLVERARSSGIVSS
jgi:hypothetical protein